MRKVLHILAELDDSDLHWILAAGGARGLPAQTELLCQGHPVDAVFLLVDGELVVSREGRRIARLGPGAVVGELSLLTAQPSRASVTAGVESLVFALPQVALRRKLGQDKGFSARFHRALCMFLADRLCHANALLEGHDPDAYPASVEDASGIGDPVLGNLSLAGARFEWFQQRVRGA